MPSHNAHQILINGVQLVQGSTVFPGKWYYLRLVLTKFSITIMHLVYSSCGLRLYQKMPGIKDLLM